MPGGCHPDASPGGVLRRLLVKGGRRALREFKVLGALCSCGPSTLVTACVAVVAEECVCVSGGEGGGEEGGGSHCVLSAAY